MSALDTMEIHELLYSLGNPIISDQEYDELAEKHPHDRIGHEVYGKKVKHTIPMLSLSKGADCFQSKLNRACRLPKDTFTPVVAEPKIDGVSASLEYKGGRLVTAATRGNGKEGLNITDKALLMDTIPKKLLINMDLKVTGEIYLPGAENGRNKTAGFLRLKVAENKGMKFFAFGTDLKVPQLQRLDELKKLGFKTPEMYALCNTQEDMETFHDKLEEIRDSLPYEIDGTVYKVNDLEIERRAGTSAKYPKYATCAKFAPKTAITEVLDIIIQEGKTGRKTPVAILKPVEISGVNISRASLHNNDHMAKLGVEIGSRVLIKRAGDVIPQIIEVISPTTL